jgi:hypothetical protein
MIKSDTLKVVVVGRCTGGVKKGRKGVGIKVGRGEAGGKFRGWVLERAKWKYGGGE